MCELANGPTTPDADKFLYEPEPGDMTAGLRRAARIKGVYVLPDFLANAGGVSRLPSGLSGSPMHAKVIP
jgi:glutamate dehydrogenase (NAD(P)+)